MSEHRGAITHEGERYPSPRRALDYLDTDPPAPGHAIRIGGEEGLGETCAGRWPVVRGHRRAGTQGQGDRQ